MPRYERIPPTEEMFAATISVTDRTLRNWKQIDGFQEEVNRMARAALKSKLPEIYGALIRRAEMGDFQHIQLLLEMVGEYTKTTKNQNESSGEVKLIIENTGLSTIPQHLSRSTVEGDTGEETL